MKTAHELYQDLIKDAKGWIRQQITSIASFPELPNGQPGIIIGTAPSSRFWRVLLPDGRLALFNSGSWAFAGYLPDSSCLSREILAQIEDAVYHLHLQSLQKATA